jgi:hypothetical protein
MTEFFVSKDCEEEKCTVCGKPASAMLTEFVFADDPDQARLVRRAYVCHRHFREITRVPAIDPKPEDVGRKVVYFSWSGAAERGKISSMNDEYVFVRFGEETSSKACRRGSLAWDD